jgi:hypothetical protein
VANVALLDLDGKGAPALVAVDMRAGVVLGASTSSSPTSGWGRATS